MSALATALSLARIGWYVFPWDGAKKKGHVRWKREASRDPDTIRDWWATWPNARIGIHTGMSRLVVVDRDAGHENGKDGFASLREAGHELPRTFHYTSSSGRGRHDVYSAPEGVELTIARDVLGMLGVDIRAGIGAAIYAGRALPKRPRLAPAPDWALVHKSHEHEYDTVHLGEWLDAERNPNPNSKALSLAESVPLRGVSNPDLLRLLTPIVDSLMWGKGRRLTYDVARERYTRHYPDSGEAFDRAWEKAVARLEADWDAVMLASPTDQQRPARRAQPEANEPSGRSRTLQLTPASAIRPRPVVWLWDGRLALGTLALLAGREGIGKSTAAYWVAARVTRGQLDGVANGKPRGVLIAATEDSWEHTIVPRLIAADADLDRVFRVEVRTAQDIHVGLSLPHDLHSLQAAATETDSALLLLDPLMSRLGEQDTHKDSEVRIALEPLVAVADRTRMAVLGIMHHNKSGSTDPLQLVMGSKAFTAVARSVHTVVNDPDDDTEQRKLFGTPKNNLGRTDLPTLTFTIASTPVQTDEGTAWTGRLVWGADIDESINSVMGRAQDTDRSATSEAAEWLEDVLSRGITASSAVKDQARKVSITLDALKRACKRLGVVITSEGFPRRTYWELPAGAQSAQPPRGEQPTALTTPTSTPTRTRKRPVGAVGAVGAVGGSPKERKPTKRTKRPPRASS